MAEDLGLLGRNLSEFVEDFLAEFLLDYKYSKEGINTIERRGWDLNPRTLTGRGSRVPRSAELCNPGLVNCYEQMKINLALKYDTLYQI